MCAVNRTIFTCIIYDKNKMNLDTIKNPPEVQQFAYNDFILLVLLFGILNKWIEYQNKVLYELQGSYEYSQEEF